MISFYLLPSTKVEACNLKLFKKKKKKKKPIVWGCVITYKLNKSYGLRSNWLNLEV